MLETYRIISGNHLLNRKCHCSVCPQKQMLQPSLNTQTRGHSLKLQTEIAAGHRKNFFATRVVKDWNSLSESTVTAPNITAFKTGLAKDWREEPKHCYTF